MSARIEDVLEAHWDFLDLRLGSHRSHLADVLRKAGYGHVRRARRDALLSAANEMDAFADMAYSPDIFVRPTEQDYAKINALLQRERGHQLDGVAADCYSRAIKVQAARLRERAVDEAES